MTRQTAVSRTRPYRERATTMGVTSEASEDRVSAAIGYGRADEDTVGSTGTVVGEGTVVDDSSSVSISSTSSEVRD